MGEKRTNVGPEVGWFVGQVNLRRESGGGGAHRRTAWPQLILCF